MPVILAFRRLEQEDPKITDILGCVMTAGEPGLHPLLQNMQNFLKTCR